MFKEDVSVFVVSINALLLVFVYLAQNLSSVLWTHTHNPLELRHDDVILNRAYYQITLFQILKFTFFVEGNANGKQCNENQ